MKTKYGFTRYFEEEVLKKRPYLKKEWCIRIVENPIKVECQEDNRWRFWGVVEEFGGRVFRVIILEDKTTIHMPSPTRGLNHEAQILP